ncbi:TIGR03086 family metal-binding protein [Nocardia sp. CDC160]|uniref:TIGR03086 family metal-binding protein n=1 Tax=Nocardia sp. CDC160 TaxID=3112166 RepID=UPI002DBFB212|nr:TIGR03086 family metal-binding protein [Nocardia sp. CDC160]MEC3920654.1 TIGR03086 family metal-binding protein [Nocardia sp. CDC160]
MISTYDELLKSGTELIALDARAVRASIAVVAEVTSSDLDRPTPCAGWTVRDLLEHMIVQHYGFAAASRGEGDIALWKPQPLGDDPVAEYQAAAEHVLAAFAEPGVLERQFPLPEVRDGIVIPGSLAISFHFIDYIVHSWDVARALGVSVEFDDDMIAAGLPVAEAVPCGEERERPGASFAPVVDAPEASGLDRILTVLGRSPGWPE